MHSLVEHFSRNEIPLRCLVLEQAMQASAWLADPETLRSDTCRGFENVTRWILNSTCQETLVFLIDNLAEEGLEGRANHNPHGLENFISRVARHHIVIKAISPTSHAVPAGDYGPPITVSSRCPTEGFSRVTPHHLPLLCCASCNCPCLKY